MLEKDEIIHKLNLERDDLLKYKQESDLKICEEIKQMTEVLEEFDNRYSELECKYEMKVGMQKQMDDEFNKMKEKVSKLESENKEMTLQFNYRQKESERSLSEELSQFKVKCSILEQQNDDLTI